MMERVAHANGRWFVYQVKLIHKINDWDAVFKFSAPNSKTARASALQKIVNADRWLVVNARRMA